MSNRLLELANQERRIADLLKRLAACDRELMAAISRRDSPAISDVTLRIQAIRREMDELGVFAVRH